MTLFIPNFTQEQKEQIKKSFNKPLSELKPLKPINNFGKPSIKEEKSPPKETNPRKIEKSWCNILVTVDDRYWVSVAQCICDNFCKKQNVTLYITQSVVLTPTVNKSGVCVTFMANSGYTMEQVEELAKNLKDGLFQKSITIETPKGLKNA